MKKIIVILSIFISVQIVFADDEHYDIQDVSGMDFSGNSHSYSTWVSSTAVNTVFSTLQNPTSYIMSNFTSADLTGANFSSAILAGATFTDATIQNASFANVTYFTKE